MPSMRGTTLASRRWMPRPWSWLRRQPAPPIVATDDSPLPFLLFNLDQLEAHARATAAASPVSARRGVDRLLPRLAANRRRLRVAVDHFSDAQRAWVRLSPAGLWLVDNHHVIEEQIRLARRHLPRGYSRALPHLLEGPFAGHPRVHQLAVEVIAHVDGRIDRENLSRFVTAWQEVAPLTLGELWAIPIMLRLALIENLRRVADRVMRGLAHRELARGWAERIVAATEKDPNALLLVAAEMARSNPSLSNAFVAELVKRLQEKGGLVDIPLTWIDHQLAALGTSLQHRVQSESGDQAANQVSVSSSIGSLRHLSAISWRDFVESMSTVEAVLRTDPSGTYPGMDFATRDRYRHAVEDMARQAQVAQNDVASLAVDLASAGVATPDGDARATHVGHYLIGRGRLALVAALPSLPLRSRLAHRWGAAAWCVGYFATLFGVTLAATALAMVVLPPLRVGWLVLLAPPLLIAASRLGSMAANWMATTFHPAVVLPRMEVPDAIPDAWRTLVIVPTLLTAHDRIAGLLEGLEVRYLGNRAANLNFGLLTDFGDAATASLPEDDALLDALSDGVRALNVRYGDADRFFLFHRAREWNPHERVWMGYERKRGKLEALNHLLRGLDRRPGAEGAAFARVVGDLDRLADTKFVITLDTDTRLPRDAGRSMIGALAHPLNRPRYDAVARRIREGYAILQPRVAIHLPSSRRSWFVRLYAGEAGTDPYTLAVSDVYQDLFGEGSFVGKGIYDIDAFTLALQDELPDNLILSHDLIEGCFARSGLLSDVLLYEEHPSHFLDDGARRRRWTRGDWQIMFWLLPWAPDRRGVWRWNPLTALSRWKIIDNLRRSAVPLATVSATVLGLVLLPGSWIVTGTVLAVTFFPPLVASLGAVMRPPGEAGDLAHLRFEARATLVRLAHAAVALAFLPEDCRNSLDAIARSVVRMTFTHRKLLEWRSAGEPTRRGLRSFIVAMGSGPLLAMGLTILHLVRGQTLLDPSLLLLVPWALSPLIAAWLSADREERPALLSGPHQDELRRLARRTWRFFETFVGPEDHALPPDNMQEVPTPVVAHRTSPTNIGLSLLSNLAAHDFGYVSTETLLRRTEDTVATLGGLERHRRHFYNWYDTTTLQPLLPLYVSTVDSGNLMGSLLVLETGLRALHDGLVVSERAWQGLGDTIDLLVLAAPPLLVPLQALRERLRTPPTTLGGAREVARLFETSVTAVLALQPSDDPEVIAWLDAVVRQGEDAIVGPLAALDPHAPLADALPTWAARAEVSLPARTLLDRARALADAVADLAVMDLDFLYDPTRGLFTIGYRVSDRRQDAGCYDLLASEVRLLSYLAIAQGVVPQAHWFALGRLVTTWNNEAALLSWSGSMFEYLMPLLFMPTFPGTLLDQTNHAVVGRQIEYGAQQGIPWGVSESGYNVTDAHGTYQYKAFGVPGLGLKRGLAEDQVVAPYATVMALMVAPVAALANLQRMKKAGFEGRYGFYEAIDYTARRRGVGARYALVRSFMAHHQGMSLLALASVLLDQPMQRRFSARPSHRATELLLQERPPKEASLYPHAREVATSEQVVEGEAPRLRVLTTAHTPRPEVHLLSNGRYFVMLTNAGGGFSRWKDLALTRWREDPTRDDWGTFCYVRDVDDGRRWSVTHQPCGAGAEHYEAIFAPSRAEFRRRGDGIDLHCEIAVSPEDDVELRRFTLTNPSGRTRTLELTTYAEVVLAPQAADEAHPAFSNLFVQTEVLPDRQAIVCLRRPRTNDDTTPALLHLMTVEGPTVGELTYETNRRTFIGRGRTTADPVGAMTGGAGSVLDPIVAIRCRVTLAPEQTLRLHVVTGVAPTRESALLLIDKYREVQMGDRVFGLAETHREVELRQLSITAAEAELYLRMLSAVLYADPLRRAPPGVLAKSRRGQSSLWGYSISGDLPIVLLRLASLDSAELVRQVVRAHAWWRRLGLRIDLVLLDETETGYENTLLDQILSVISVGFAPAVLDAPGGIFVRRWEQFTEADRILVQTLARLVLTGAGGTLTEQLARQVRAGAPMPRLAPRRPPPAALRDDEAGSEEAPGFSDDGRAFRIVTTPTRPTPAPWSNVLANPHFGTLMTESGSAYTWCENAHEFRLTPWDNDPVSGRSGEAMYLRDEESGAFWSPTPLPAGGTAPYVTQHAFGVSTYSHTSHGVLSELTVFVAVDAPVKVMLLKLTNRTGRRRSLSVTGYCEWVLGEHRPQSLLHVTTELDAGGLALFARNPYHAEFGARIGFFDVSTRARTVTGDRTEFLGRNGHPARPAAMERERLSGRVGSGLDACAAMMAPVELSAGGSVEIVFILGVGRDVQDVRTLLHRFGQVSTARQALLAVRGHWQTTLTAVQIQTPEPTLDVLVNGWLPYQVIACRMWARTGFFQSGGAFGFRDQLQDAMALLHVQPAMLRAHIVRCAGRQFIDGDVQHWWHPPSGRGVRTHCSDDYLWLPAAVARYVLGVGDTGVLQERTPYLEGREVRPDEEAYGDLPHRSEVSGTVYEHCVRAIERGLRFGVHGLPLMGSGDWNDGMNLVGARGRGESVWLAFFLYDVLVSFAHVALRHEDPDFAQNCRQEAAALATRIEQTAWDGEWYRRGYFDSGQPLGSQENSECQIDSLPQSWAVLSGAGPLERARAAMEAVDARLVDRPAGIVKLFAPPFDVAEPNPGYIRGYVPGVRENGGQYTHAALWAAMAFAQLGDWRRAWELTSMLHPGSHTATAADRERYRVEPYVMAADVYAVAPHEGMGGWTWHTGSAGWMLRLTLESLLGLRLTVDRLSLVPCVPPDWSGFTIRYRYRQTVYELRAHPAAEGERAGSMTLDGTPLPTPFVTLIDDRKEHVVVVVYEPSALPGKPAS